MANIVTRRLLGRNLLRLKEPTLITRYSTCTSIFVINLDHNKNCTLFHNYQHRLPHFIGHSKIQLYSDDNKVKKVKKDEEPKLSLFQRFKMMYKDYWYVLVPVHVATSVVWFGGFYYLAKSGVDIPALLESWSISERITNPLRDSSMGYIAVAYALYKIATPARYTVTLGGTTISINYLKKWGYIKPVPSPERLKEMYREQKDQLLGTMRDTKEGLKDKKENIIEDLDKGIKQIKELGDKMKSNPNKEHCYEEVKKKEKDYKTKD